MPNGFQSSAFQNSAFQSVAGAIVNVFVMLFASARRRGRR